MASTTFASVALLGILICAYSAQAWAKKCHDELRAIRKMLEERN